MKTNRERVEAANKILVDRGVIDFKFHADYTAPLDKLLGEVADILEAIIEGRCYPAKPIGDSVK